MAAVSQARRYVLRLGVALIGAFGLVRYLGAGPKVAGESLRVPRRDVPAEGALVFADRKVALVRRGEETFALSLVCTHLGCTVNVLPDGIACPCHGSRFDLAGAVVSGPAPRALERLPLVVDGDQLTVSLKPGV